MNPAVPAPRDAVRVLDDEFLIIRGRILELAAALDRLDHAPDPSDSSLNGEPGHRAVFNDPRLERIRQALRILSESSTTPDRARRIQELFSRPYQPDWMITFGIPQRRF